MLGRLGRRLRREEEGFVLVLAVTLLVTMGTLGALVLTTGSHTDQTTARGRAWIQALHVAEAGVERAIARLEQDETFRAPEGTPLSGSVAEGDYSVVVEGLARGRLRLTSTGTAGEGRGLTATRQVRVTMAAPSGFPFALFSLTSIDTKNNDTVFGGVWANENVIVDDGDLIEGDVTAANGYIKLKQNSRVVGDVTSGDYNGDDSNRAIHLENGARIEGDVWAGTTLDACPTEPAGAYDVNLASSTSTITGSLTTCGAKTGNGATPSPYNPSTFYDAPATLEIPEFTWDPDNYDADSLHEYTGATAVTDFQAFVEANSAALSGTFYVEKSGTVNQDAENRLEIEGVTISGDLTVVSNTPIFIASSTASTNDAIIVIVSTYEPPSGSSCDVNHDRSECSIHIKNNLDLNNDDVCDPDDDPAALFYAKYGPVAIKNNETQCGSVYAQNIQIKNNQTLTYDDRVDRTIGFGDVTYEALSWVELDA